MNILNIIPPFIPSYFNAGHHLPVFTVSAYLRKNIQNVNASALDYSVLNASWKNICELLVNNNFDVIAVMNDFDGVDTFERFVHYCKKLSPSSKLITFGRMSKQNASLFKRFDFDAIHYSGDYEAGIYDYVVNLDSGILPPGFIIKKNSSYIETGHGRELTVEDWVFPDVTDIPYSHYDEMYMDDFNKFCGIPQRRELVVPVARGCSIGCKYCDVPAMQGNKERRVSVDYTLHYIEESFRHHPFDYVTFYAPTFTLNKGWVLDLCEKITDRKIKIPWKCVTTLALLNERLLKIMAAAGCFRISVGVETMEAEVQKINLPKTKAESFSKLEKIVSLCKENGIELNCFIMLGLPGDSVVGVRNTIEYIHSNNARFRPTIYTSYHEINDDMPVSDVALYNRQLFANRNYGDKDESEYYKLFHGYKFRRDTMVHENIPKNKIGDS
ncbi:B12-binding domain-containing radical SAM protein [Xenorhabdus bovienii]|uniref:B12-binding domain-containing radical SAM protein n=1 Tax=Xenorhabdus bovienii TaxID=40576 RepID=UPI0023B2EF8A|nr:radical SAM protein [Xenorhabdus bovienii]MDE9541063.1 radical SAM protein [Xenorhabdus bovienii]